MKHFCCYNPVQINGTGILEAEEEERSQKMTSTQAATLKGDGGFTGS